MEPTFDAVTLQTTKQCNLKCRYCYLGHSASVSDDVGFMSVDIVKKVFNDLIVYHKAKDIDTGISCTFHGGEPLLLGHKFFRETLEFFQDLEDKFGIPIKKSLQTNLTLLDQEYCQIFKKHDVSVGTSIDGPREMHDRHRVMLSGGTHERIMRNVQLARDNGIDVGAICTVTKDKLHEAKKIYDFFLENNMGFKTNSLFLQGAAIENWQDLRISLQEFGNFFCELFDMWYDGPSSVMAENLTEVMLIVLKGAEYGDCSSINCAHRQFTVTHTGECTPCGRTVGIDGFALGNVKEDDFFKIAESSTFKFLSLRVPDKIEECAGCDLKTVCYSGCMYDAYLEHGTIFAPGGDCAGFRHMYEHVRSRMLEDVTRYSINVGGNDGSSS